MSQSDRVFARKEHTAALGTANFEQHGARPHGRGLLATGRPDWLPCTFRLHAPF